MKSKVQEMAKLAYELVLEVKKESYKDKYLSYSFPHLTSSCILSLDTKVLKSIMQPPFTLMFRS